MIDFICKLCGKKFQSYPSRKNKKLFCSRKCLMESLRLMAKARIGKKHQNWKKRKIVKCHICGTRFEKYPKQVRKKNFCSLKCRNIFISKISSNRCGDKNPNWKGGKTNGYRGANWRRIRKKILERDNFKCKICGQPAKNVHHKKPFRLFKTFKQANRASNLISLCKKCHGIEESKIYHAEKVPAKLHRKIQCKRCGNPFMPDKIWGPKRFCDKCRLYKKCETCGIKIDVTSRQKKLSQVKFCSKICLGKSKAKNLEKWRLNKYRRQLPADMVEKCKEN